MVSSTFILICITTLQYIRVQSDSVNPEYCAPRPSLISINSPYYKYFPYFVELHRCGGSCSSVSPRIQRCSAASIQTISKSVFDLSDQKSKVLQFVNHTRCNCSCTQSPGTCDDRLEIWNPDTCSCKCKIPAGKTYPCPENFKWNQYICRCQCNLPPKDCDGIKVWNGQVCGCVCSFDALTKCEQEKMQMDRNTCRCYREPPPATFARGGKGVPRGVMIGCMVAELFLILLLFDVFLYCRYGDGVVTALNRRFCSKKKPHEDVPLKTENAETC